MDYNHFFEANKKLWNAKTAYHVSSDFYAVDAFKKGACSLNTIELDALGDISGKSILHLQCHFGMDSISLSRRGAKVTGIDLSEEAINEAKKLAKELGTDTEFIACNVYDLKEHLNKTYDIVFTSYGVIGWLPDLDKWADIIQHFLKPGGELIFAEFHPVVWMMDEDFKNIKYHYFNVELIKEISDGTYADNDADIKMEEYSWNHSMSETLTALLNQGLSIKRLEEYDYSPYPCFSHVEEYEKGKWRIKHLGNKLPMVYLIQAKKES